MNPVALIIGMVLCVLAMIALALMGLDNWTRGNRGFAFALFILAAFALGIADATVDQIEKAYAERTGRQP